MKIKDGVEIAVPCKCREKAVMSRRLRFADIPEAFCGMDLRSFRMDVYRKQESKKMVSDACKIIKTYLDDFESQKERGMGLYIWSRTKGSGHVKAVAIRRYTGGILWDGSEIVSNGCVQEAGK